MAHRILMIGPPASGKGTQGQKLADKLKIPYLSTGALLRAEVLKKSKLGLFAEPILARGQYLSDDFMCDVIQTWLTTDSHSSWLLDGFPRSLPQAQFLDQVLRETEQMVTHVISLAVPFEILMSRVTGRRECPACHWTGQLSDLLNQQNCPRCSQCVTTRSDDTESNFRVRYAQFEKITAPVIDYYAKQDRVISCSAIASREEVAANLWSLISAPSSLFSHL